MSLVKLKKLKITLTTKSPIRIGGSKDPLKGLDNPVISINGKFVIPGSSLKGALRNRLEEIFIDLANKKNNDDFRPCIPSDRPSENEEKNLINNKKYKGKACNLKSDESNKSDRQNQISICPVCYFLGANGLPGFVRIPFLWLENQDFVSEIITNISIDRATKTARKGGIFKSEIIPQDSTFSGELEILEKDQILDWEFGKPRIINDINVDKWLDDFKNIYPSENIQAKLLEILKNAIKDIKILGGYKSKGFGDVEINIEEIQ